jgi:hypothetical protein
MPKYKPNKIPNPYTLSHRVRAKNGDWGEWSSAIGQWFGIDQAKSQVMMLKRSRKDRDMEFKIFYEGKYLNLKEEVIEGSFMLDIRK